MLGKSLFLTIALFAICVNLESSQLVIVRHGQGWHNIGDVYSSWTEAEGGADHPLTKKGQQQVAATAQKLLDQGINHETVGLVLVSPLRRTRQTAQILMEHGVFSEKVLEIENRIREPQARDLEGLAVPPRAKLDG